jgi:hypothetical protein
VTGREQKLILWTIQPEDVYKELVKTGIYHCRPEEAFMYENWKEAYDWLASQMKKRVGLPPEGVTLPVWAWYQWEGARKKPDLRKERWGSGFCGEKFVCLECDIPDHEVLLSDFGSWSIVLSNSLIYWTEEEYNKTEPVVDALPEEEQKVMKYQNWSERLFDLTPLDNDWITRGSSIQATFWELRLEQVREIRHFVAASKKPTNTI